METRVKILYRPSTSTNVFGEFSISFNAWDGVDRSVKLKFDLQQLWSFSRDTTSIAFDFLILSFIVYNVDRAINRQKHSIDGWQRNIRLENVPVINLDSMNKGKDAFNRAISFLTGDLWDIHFVQANSYNYHPIKNIKDYNKYDIEKVALFSGGLDSLIGFIDEVSSLKPSKKILLISHMELGKEHKDQQGILDYCRNHNLYDGKFEQLLLNAGLRPKTWNINKTPTESTFRSRSLLFFAAGIYTAYHIGSNINLIVPENGTISINIPLDKGRRSACSTRTTHPVFISKLEKALSLIGIDNKFINPYKLDSKKDMVEKCCSCEDKKNLFMQLAPLSCSCAKRGHNRFWDKTSLQIESNNIKHCGMCLPCLYRRVSLNAVGLDDEAYLGTDVLNGQKFNLFSKGQKRNRDFRALLFFLKNRMNESVIKRELMMNGVHNENELKEYVRLAIHSYDQVLDWLKEKAPTNIKKIVGL